MYDIDKEAEAKRKAELTEKEEEPADLEEEVDLEEYNATLGPCLKMVLKDEDLFVMALQPGRQEADPNTLYQVIPNPAGPPLVDGEKVTWYQWYGGRYVDKSYKGVWPTPLVDKIWDLEYVGTCGTEECYKRLLHVCAWLHDLEIKARPKEDPTGVKRKMEDSENESDAKGPSKKLKKEVSNKAKPGRRVRSVAQKAKLRKQKKTTNV